MCIIVTCAARTIEFDGKTYPCRSGQAGTADKRAGREGDKKTPLGQYHLRFGLYRADRLARPHSALNLRPMRRDDGWCDAPDNPAYNRFIRLPYKASHEALWREDAAYDIILVMSHNDSPPEAKLGSAVFIHIMQVDQRQTLGCIALSPDTMIALLAQAHCGQPITIM